jgi:hypothetical protein
MEVDTFAMPIDSMGDKVDELPRERGRAAEVSPRAFTTLEVTQADGHPGTAWRSTWNAHPHAACAGASLTPKPRR